MSVGFIAETDARGEVVWVWRKASSERIARPIMDASACFHELSAAEFSGAAPKAISEWFLRQTKGKIGRRGG